MPRFRAEALEEFATELLAATGLGAADARLTAQLLVKADLQGYPGHGVAHLGSYLARIEQGVLQVTDPPAVELDAPTSARLDGKLYVGQVVAHRAMSLAIAKARQHGVGVVAARRAGHMGRLADYVELAAEQGMISMATVSVSSTSIPPYGGIGGVGGTNPMAFGVPGRNGRHFILDFATAAMSRGELNRLIARRQPIPEGVLLDPEGNPTTDYAALGPGQRGILVPFGGHKGAGLHLLTELLGGIFSGHGPGKQWEGFASGGAVNAGCFLAVRADLFRPLDEFAAAVDDFLDFVKSRRRRPGFDEIFFPGERGRRHAERSKAEGVEIEEPEWAQLAERAQSLGVPLPSPIAA